MKIRMGQANTSKRGEIDSASEGDNQTTQICCQCSNDSFIWKSDIDCFESEDQPSSEHDTQPGLVHMPDAVLLQIALFLPQGYSLRSLSQTCNRLNKLVTEFHDRLWERPHLQIQKSQPGCLVKALRTPDIVTSVSVRDAVWVDDRFMCYLAQHCPLVKYLDISGCVLVTDSGLDVLASNLATNLNFLAVAGTRRVTWAGLDHVLREHGSKLEHLDISNALGLVTSTTSHTMLTEVHNLKTLKLSWSCRKERGNKSILWDHELADIIVNNLQLEEVDISHGNIGPRTLRAISATSEKLIRLSLAHTLLPLDQMVGLINSLSEFGNLKHINLSGCFTVEGSMLTAIAHNLPKLEEIDLSRCSRIKDEDLQELVASLPKLRALRVHDCRRLRGTGWVDLVPDHPSLAYVDVSNTLLEHIPINKHPVLVFKAQGCPLGRDVDSWLSTQYPLGL